MVIHWHTPKHDKNNTIYLKSKDDTWAEVTGKHESIHYLNIHTVDLRELTPNTEYQFKVGKDETIYKFKTAPETLRTSLKFVIGGDADQTSSLFEKMNEQIVKEDPLFCVIGGDIAYAVHTLPFGLNVGAFNRWVSFLSIWQKQMITKEKRLIPLIIGIGNHDITKKTENLVFSFFPIPERRFYRSLDFGSYMSLILLDTDHFDPIEGEQTKWLEKTLIERSKTPFRFAVYHEAAYPSYYPYNGKIPTLIRKNWCPLFEEYKISAAFENHNHAFKRTFPIMNEEIRSEGIIYFGDGAWGAKPRQTKDQWYLEKRGQENNVYIIEVKDASSEIRAINLKGEVIDRKLIPALRTH